MTQSSAPRFDLDRFVKAQEGVYESALAEIRAGRKRCHWMWFIFPQVAGLGFSATSQHFAIRTREEAEAYLKHPQLGPRLIECVEAVLEVQGRSAEDIFGPVDALKLRSCSTLFAAISPPGSIFHSIIDKYFDAQADERTVQLLGPDG